MARNLNVPIGVTMILLGLVVSVFIIIANEESVLIDQVVTDMGINAYELGFVAFMLFFIGGMFTEVILSKRKVTTYHFITNIFTFIFCIFLLSASATASVVAGGASTGIANMLSELYDFGYFFAFAYIVYLIYLFIARR